jgi:murein L,D-transpeptidase YafK
MFRPVGLMILLLFSMPQAQAYGYDDPWIMVDTQRQTLVVMQGEHVQQAFAGISVGYGGTAELRFRGDGRTPKGVFQIGWINPQSKFHVFFGLDYPNLDQAKRAYQSAQIDYQSYQKISQAVAQGQTPPQDTALGGYIGIHGLGNKDPGLHKTLNWTEGCVALTNEQIDQLARWVGVGTQVVIF